MTAAFAGRGPAGNRPAGGGPAAGGGTAGYDGPAVGGQGAAMAVYEAALRRADAGHQISLTLRDDRGDDHRVDAAAWCGRDVPGDADLLDRCAGPTLDVGCGPGRLAGELLNRGHPALGIDVSLAAVGLARRRGVSALRRDVFGRLPGHGRWQHLLLADGNIGIGGAPRRLLRRCRDLLAPEGRLHIEVTGPGTRTWSGVARIRAGDGPGAPLRWASVAIDDLPGLAVDTGLRIVDVWTEAGRWFASLART